jgi:hypothetical protein
MLLIFTDNANNSDEIKKELGLASWNKLTVIITQRAFDVNLDRPHNCSAGHRITGPPPLLTTLR